MTDRDTGIDNSKSTQSTARKNTAKIVVDRPEHIEIDVSSVSPQLLVLSERFSAGWTASITDSPVPILRAEIDFMGCVVPAGNHTVLFSFESVSVKTGRLISTMAMIQVSVYAAIRLVPWKTFRGGA